MYSFAIRTVERDTLFLMADVQLEGAEEPLRVTVRNLSAAGMMVERDRRVKRGQRVTVELRNLGQVTGMVVWARNPIFGIAFDDEIDHQLARASPAGQSRAALAYAGSARPAAANHRWAVKLRCV